jgi:hypothetical protein
MSSHGTVEKAISIHDAAGNSCMALQQPRFDRMRGREPYRLAPFRLDRMLHLVLPPDVIAIVYVNATATHGATRWRHAETPFTVPAISYPVML